MTLQTGDIKLRNGVSFHYSDSGAVEGSHKVLILLHGIAFDLRIWQRIQKLAPENKLRLVAVNRRDYEPSSPFTEQELNRVSKKDAPAHDFVDFFVELGKQTAEFITLFKKENSIKEPISILGWSLGVETMTALLAALPLLSGEDKTELESSLDTVIFFDPPYFALGFDKIPGWSPLQDPTLSQEEAAQQFGPWVSGYFDHPDIYYPDASKLEDRKWSQSKPPTLANFTPEELKMNNEKAAVAFDGLGISTAWTSGGLAALREKALIDGCESLPNVKVVYLRTTNSLWQCAAGPLLMEKQIKQDQKAGKKSRPITFQEIQGANHFPHWDMPEQMITELQKAIGA